MKYYLSQLLPLIVILIIGALIFGANGIIWTLFTFVGAATATHLIHRYRGNLKQGGGFTLLATIAIIIVTSIFLTSINHVYQKEARAESLLNDDGITKITLTVRRAPQNKSLTSQEPKPRPTLMPSPKSWFSRGPNWLQALLAKFNF